jgi:hypothetical protein
MNRVLRTPFSINMRNKNIVSSRYDTGPHYSISVILIFSYSCRHSNYFISKLIHQPITFWAINESVYDSRYGLKIFLIYITYRPALGPTQPLTMRTGFASQGKSGRDVKLTSQPMLRMVELYLHCPILLYGLVLN